MILKMGLSAYCPKSVETNKQWAYISSRNLEICVQKKKKNLYYLLKAYIYRKLKCQSLYFIQINVCPWKSCFIPLFPYAFPLCKTAAIEKQK